MQNITPIGEACLVLILNVGGMIVIIGTSRTMTMSKDKFPLQITDQQALKLVQIIKKGSDRSGVLVMKSLAASLCFKEKVKEEKSIEEYLGINGHNRKF
jgi:hypothetical protein